MLLKHNVNLFINKYLETLTSTPPPSASISASNLGPHQVSPHSPFPVSARHKWCLVISNSNFGGRESKYHFERIPSDTEAASCICWLRSYAASAPRCWGWRWSSNWTIQYSSPPLNSIATPWDFKWQFNACFSCWCSCFNGSFTLQYDWRIYRCRLRAHLGALLGKFTDHLLLFEINLIALN